ncbi:MAG: hypothetical protein M3125_09185 [Gemmatimonadota bacterium]|nr:hypothetical protein [Gemmatimonadota bacterium]
MLRRTFGIDPDMPAQRLTGVSLASQEPPVKARESFIGLPHHQRSDSTIGREGHRPSDLCHETSRDRTRA